MKYVKVVLICAVLAVSVLAQAPKAIDSTPKATVLPVPEVDQLQWSNLRLDATARRAQAETLRMQADALEKQSNDKLNEIKVKMCGHEADQFDFQLNADGKMQLVRKPEKKETK